MRWARYIARMREVKCVNVGWKYDGDYWEYIGICVRIILKLRKVDRLGLYGLCSCGLG